MAQTCIVCLGDLRVLDDTASDTADPALPGEARSLRKTRLTSKKYVPSSVATASVALVAATELLQLLLSITLEPFADQSQRLR